MSTGPDRSPARRLEEARLAVIAKAREVDEAELALNKAKAEARAARKTFDDAYKVVAEEYQATAADLSSKGLRA